MNLKDKKQFYKHYSESEDFFDEDDVKETIFDWKNFLLYAKGKLKLEEVEYLNNKYNIRCSIQNISPFEVFNRIFGYWEK